MLLVTPFVGAPPLPVWGPLAGGRDPMRLVCCRVLPAAACLGWHAALGLSAFEACALVC